MKICRLEPSSVPRQQATRRADEILRTLCDAWDEGDEPAIRRLLHPGAILVIDSGGQVPAPRRPVRGSAAVAAALRRTAADFSGAHIGEVRVNGQRGLAFRDAGRVVAVMSVGFVGRRIGQIWMTVNPSKLTRWNDS
jgi:RNA polymerase sigma-70 factor (ECF subfamily)